MDHNWKARTWCAISVRATGVGCFDLEIGAVLRHDPGEPECGRLCWFAFPELGEVTQSPFLTDAAEGLLALIGEAHVIAAHDWPRAYSRLCDAIGPRWWTAVAGRVVIDTRVLVRAGAGAAHWRGRDPYGLEAAAKRLGVKTTIAPSPAADCALILGLLDHYAPQLIDDGPAVVDMIIAQRAAQRAADAKRAARRAAVPAQESVA